MAQALLNPQPPQATCEALAASTERSLTDLALEGGHRVVVQSGHDVECHMGDATALEELRPVSWGVSIAVIIAEKTPLEEVKDVEEHENHDVNF